MKVDLSLLFQKNLKDTNKMVDIITFVDIMHQLYAKCISNTNLESAGETFEDFMENMI